MNLILILIAELFISSLTKNIIYYETMEFILLIVNIFLVGIYVGIKIDNKKTLAIIYLAYLFRIIFMMYDINIANLPFSGADTWSFHYAAVNISEKLPYVMLETPFGVYAQFLGIVYYLFGGPAKMFAQHINIIFFILSTIHIIEIFKIYEVKSKYINLSIILYTWFMPVAMFQSAILLREMPVVYFMTLSICSLLKQLKTYKPKYIVKAYIFLFIAGMFHSGVVFASIPYTYILSVYNSKSGKFEFTSKSMMILIFSVIIVVFGFNVFGDYFTHLKEIENIQSIIDKVNKTEYAKQAGSGYLKNLQVVGTIGLIIFTPLKLLYFLFSPMPWQIRGVMDVITFLMDVVIYMIIIYAYLNIRKSKNKLPLKIYNTICMLYTIYLTMEIPYAWGTFAGGTAIRHRFKGFFIILIAYTIYKNYLNEYNEKLIYKELRHESIAYFKYE